MSRWPALALVLLPVTAHAKWPEDIDLYSMTEQDGLPVLDRELLGKSYRQLVMELGTLVSNKPVTPAGTLGLYGFDFDLSNQFILTEARDRGDDPSPWTRAHAEERSTPYHMIPTLSVRKGLPLSTEIGGTMGWIGGSASGIVGGWGRIAVLEGFKPLPDVSLKLGYSGLVGNEQIDCGALDLSVTVGSTFPVGRLVGVNTGQISPWLTFTTLRVSANATIDQEVENDIGALRYSRGGDDEVEPEAPIAIPEVGGGVQFVAGTAHIRVGASWAPATIPTISTGFGFTF